MPFQHLCGRSRGVRRHYSLKMFQDLWWSWNQFQKVSHRSIHCKKNRISSSAPKKIEKKSLNNIRIFSGWEKKRKCACEAPLSMYIPAPLFPLLSPNLFCHLTAQASCLPPPPPSPPPNSFLRSPLFLRSPEKEEEEEEGGKWVTR